VKWTRVWGPGLGEADPGPGLGEADPGPGLGEVDPGPGLGEADPGPGLGEADPAHGAHGAVLAAPVRVVVVVLLLQDVVGPPVVGLLVHGPPAHKAYGSLSNH